jgi:hypothetical protein
MRGGDEKCIQYFYTKQSERVHSQDLGVDGITIYHWIYKAKCKGLDWINLAQDSAQWRALVNTAINSAVP